MLAVETKNATYWVDRAKGQWMRTTDSHPKEFDGFWVEGGFTLGEVGESCFAHFADFRGGAPGRATSRVVSIFDPAKEQANGDA